MKQLEVTFAPAEFQELPNRDLSRTVCVVFDVLRATSSMIAALGSGATGILPVSEIAEALQAFEARPDALLAGERDGLRIRAELTGSVDFHLGNSPREFTPDRVAGKTVIMTTTNGTRALRAVQGAQCVLASCFQNLNATADHLRREAPEALLLVCGGTFEQMAYEDVLAAGALAQLLWPDHPHASIADSAWMARTLYEAAAVDLPGALGRSRNGRRLLSRAGLQADVPFCAALDTTRIVAVMGSDGVLRSQL